jgi:DNA-binding TFAR19-related protein (PDSD5 family)
VSLLSDDADLDLWKRRKLLEMQKRFLVKKAEEEKRKAGEEVPPKEKTQARDVLKKIFVGRAFEVWDAAWKQYPQVMERLEPNLARLVLSGEITEHVDEGQLLQIMRMIGLKLRFDVKIKILEHGKFKTISEKLKEA